MSKFYIIAHKAEKSYQLVAEAILRAVTSGGSRPKVKAAPKKEPTLVSSCLTLKLDMPSGPKKEDPLAKMAKAFEGAGRGRDAARVADAAPLLQDQDQEPNEKEKLADAEDGDGERRLMNRIFRPDEGRADDDVIVFHTGNAYYRELFWHIDQEQINGEYKSGKMDGMDGGLVKFFQRLLYAQGIVFIIRDEAF